MHKFEKIQIIKNIGSSWFSLGVNVLVGIFLSPFIVHRLGDTAFGIWVLIFSITGYYGIFDMGIRSSVIRYVSKYTATNENDQLARHVNTSLATYTVIGLLSMAVTVVLSFHVDRLFKIPTEMHSQAQLLLLLVGASVSLGFPLGVTGGILEGLQRFYLLNWTGVVMTLARAGLIIYFLDRGYGLITIALITVLLPVVIGIVRVIIVIRLLPISYGPKYVDREAFRHMAHFGGATMILLVAQRLRFQTDEMVIGGMLSAAAITYFSIGARIMDYALQVVITLAQVFLPMSSQSEAVGNLDRVRKIYVAGNRACALTTFPITAIVLILGKSIIEVWMGRKYVPLSYPVLVVLAIPVSLLMMQAASGRVLMGMGKHRDLAIVSFIEGVGNLILSIALVKPLGIVGDALGTAIPLALTMLYFTPRHMRKHLGVPVGTFVREAYALPFLLVLPFVAVLLVMRRWFPAHHFSQFVLQVVIGGIVYGIGLLWAYKTKRALKVDFFSDRSASAANATVVPALSNGLSKEA